MALFSRRRIYLDYAGSTPVLKEALREYERVSMFIGNPGALHVEAVSAKKELKRAREHIAREMGCKSREIVFTSGGTEANNLAILGCARALERNGTDLKETHWIVSSIEHPSVLECFGEVERLGGAVTFIDPDQRGMIQPEFVSRALRTETVFVSIGWTNSEIGVVQPIAEIARAIRQHEESHHTTVLLHADAGQGPLYRAGHVHTLSVDLFTLDSGKLYGPRGIGALYLSNRVELAPTILGGKQERGLRAGTENVALAAGFSAAFQIISRERDKELRRLSELKARTIKKIRIVFFARSSFDING